MQAIILPWHILKLLKHDSSTTNDVIVTRHTVNAVVFFQKNSSLKANSALFLVFDSKGCLSPPAGLPRHEIFLTRTVG